MMKRSISMLLAIILVLSAIPFATVSAQEEMVYRGSSPASSVENESICLTPASVSDEFVSDDTAQVMSEDDRSLSSFAPMKSSQNLIDVIKDAEGFRATPYWDYMQWSIGYGTVCGYEPDGSDVPGEYWGGISEEKAEQLLMHHVKNYAEDDVNYFYSKISKGRKSVPQNEFDAMVDFTYALGSSWIYDGSRVADYLKNPTTEVDLVRALGAWCRVGGSVFGPTCSRRIRESLIYLDGSYYLPYGSDSVAHSDLDVVLDDDLPRFKYTIFNGNGVNLINTRTDDVNYYHENQNYGKLPKPVRSDYTFYGWVKPAKEKMVETVQEEQVLLEDSGMEKLLLENSKADENCDVTAGWIHLPFEDVDSEAWYSSAVAYCYKNDIMKGKDEKSFEPGSYMNRAMLVTTLYRLADEPNVKGSSGFTDVSSDKYYAKAVNWAQSKGIVKGFDDGTFRPNELLNRAQMVTFISRYAAVMQNKDINVELDLSKYQDAEAIPSYAVQPFKWALSVGLVNGTGDNNLSPADYASRAQLAKVLMLLVNQD